MNVILIILGAVCQILGLWWLAVNVSRERVELGEAGFVQRIWESLKLLLGPDAQAKPVGHRCGPCRRRQRVSARLWIYRD